MLALISSLALFAPAAALAPHRGSVARSERKEILRILRKPVEARLGPPIEFVVTTYRTNPHWAFVQAEPQRAGGKAIDGRRFYGADWDNMDGLTTTAILHKGAQGWRIVEIRVGATDAWYCGFVPTKQFDPCGTYPAND